MTLHVELNSPDNNGWHMHVRRVVCIDSNGEEHIVRSHDTEGVLFGPHKGDSGPYQHDFDFAE